MARVRVDINGVIGENFWNPEASNTTKTVMEQIDEAQPGDTLEVHINSGGGSFFEGLAIFNTLRGYEQRGYIVETFVDGLAASAASLIMLAGSERVIGTGAMVMIHNVASWGYGDAKAFEKTAKTLRQFNSTASELYEDRTDLSRTEALALMDEETWLDAAKALEAGFATRKQEGEDEAAARARASACILPANLKHVPAWMRAAAATGAVKPPELTPAMIAGERPAAGGQAVPKGPDVDLSRVTGSAAGTAPPSPPASPPPGPSAGQKPQEHAMSDDPAKPKPGEARKAVVALFHNAKASGLLDDGAIQNLELEAAEQDWDVDKARSQLMDAVLEAKKDKPENKPAVTAGTGTATITADARDKFVMGATQAMLAQAGAEKHDPKNEFSGLGLQELARMSLIKADAVPAQRAAALNRSDLAEAVMSTHTTTDFPKILENVGTKLVLTGYNEAEEVYEPLCRQGTVPDFKEVKAVGLGNFTSLPQVREGAEYTYATIGERGAVMAVAKYGQLLSLTEEMLINDDVGQFVQLASKFGMTAANTAGDLFWAIFTSNPNLNGSPLFSSGRKNLRTGGGSAFGDAALTAGYTQFTTRAMADTDGGAGTKVLKIKPKFLIVPQALYDPAWRFLNSGTINGTGGALGGTPNSHAGRYTLVSDARLDVSVGGSSRWFFAADPRMHDTIIKNRLAGRPAPRVTRHEEYKRDVITWKISDIVGISPLDYVGLQRNDGA